VNMMVTLVRQIVEPATEPVTTAEAKAHLRIEHSLDDDYIDVLIKAGRQYLERIAWGGFVTQTWELVLDLFPSGEEILLPKGKLASVTSVTYLDLDGVEQTWASSNYEADTTSRPGKLRLAYQKTWPITRSRWNAIVIRYIVGQAVADVPAPIKQALLLLVSQMYEHRTPEITGTIVSKVDFAVNALIAPYRLQGF
jgi:uncharacterized phiE125 gp8 family phage protein